MGSATTQVTQHQSQNIAPARSDTDSGAPGQPVEPGPAAGSPPQVGGPWVCSSTPLQPQYEPTYYVSTAGDDSASGRSADTAFRTLQRAADAVRPGDVVWVRGGVYASDVSFHRSGAEGQPIVFESYPGECAVLDGEGKGEGHNVRFESVRFYVFRNFIVRNNTGQGIRLVRSSDNLISHVRTHHNGLSGIQNVSGDRNHFSYFITHDNSDGRRGNADGIGLSAGSNHRIDHCVAYRNSDDGVDTWRSVGSVVERCISFENGFQGGDGNGFKAGGHFEKVDTVVRYSISFGNKADGFTYNSGLNVTFEHNTAYANGNDGFIVNRGALRNNLAYGNETNDFKDDGNNDLVTNSWDLGMADDPFVSTDPSDPGFMALADSNPLLGQATDIGGHADPGAIPHGETIESFLGIPLAEILDF